MIALIIQTVLLFAIAFILGCVIGCLLRSLFGTSTEAAEDPATEDVAAKPAAVSQTSTVQKVPIAPRPPVPTTPVLPEESARVETPPAAFVPTVPVEKTSAPKKPAPVVKKQSEKAPSTPARKMAIAAAVTPDNLKLIRGIGPQNEARLNGLGVNSFVQIASWTRADQTHFGEVLSFPGRIEREEWVPQAKVLAKGGTTDFSKRVRQGTVKSSTGDAVPTDMGTKPAGLLTAPRGEKGDNLTLIDGVGNALERKLFKLGIYHFDQIGGMSAAELRWLGNSVGFPGRPERENWAGESKVLAAGGTTEHAQRVERGQIKTSRKSDD